MLAAGVAIGDQAEAQTVPYMLGIAHPTGFPAYILAGWAFSHIVAFGTVAWRLNAFTAFVTALSAAGVYLIAVALTGEALAALLAGIVFALGAVIWHGALQANAQSLAALCAIATLYASVIAARTGHRGALVAACVCCGVGMAAHPQALWSVPAIVTAAVWQRSQLNVRTIMLCIAGIGLPLLLYAYLPLRSAYVAHHHLDPTAALHIAGSGHVDWDMNTPRTKAGFLDEVFGLDEHAGETVVRALNPRRTFGAVQLWFNVVTAQYGLLVPLLALCGIAARARRDPRTQSVLLAGTAGAIAFSYVYRTNVNLDRYLIVPYAVTAALAAAAERLELPRLRRDVVGIAVTAILAFVVALSIAGNRPPASAAMEGDGEALIADVRASIPDGAIVVAPWNEAAALGYGANIEGALGTRTIVSAWPWEDSAQMPMWLRTRQVFIYIGPSLHSGPLPAHLRLERVPDAMSRALIFAVEPPLTPR
jgi:4-amino-4-deoxy-L-arabinose transferase-like glycosyltransferase